jgi:hypothetical protein
MEVRVESAEGCSMPTGCFVGVRIGETLKQGRYEPQRCYHFPQIDRRRNAKIDLYQHVGTCTVSVDPDAKSNHDVAVTSTSPEFPGLRLKVAVAAKSDDTEKKQREQRVKTLKNQANDYLAKHNIEERLSEAVKALLKEQPADPTDFLCKVLRNEAPGAAPPQQKSQPPASEQPSLGKPKKETSGESLRTKAANKLMEASENGELCNILNEIKSEAKPAATTAPAPAAPPKQKVPPPKVVTMPVKVGPPAKMINSMTVTGPAFASMGFRPTMMFI